VVRVVRVRRRRCWGDVIVDLGFFFGVVFLQKSEQSLCCLLELRCCYFPLFC